MKLGDLELEFGRAPEPVSSWSHHTPVVETLEKFETTPNPAPSAEIEATQQKISRDSLELDEIRLKEDQLALLAIEDPATYEQLVADGELDEDERLSDGDDGS